MTDDLPLAGDPRPPVSQPDSNDVVEPTEPVAASAVGGPGSSRRSPRRRWTIALGIVGVVAAGTVAAILLFGGATRPEALAWVPGDSMIVVEVRPELPGDQRQHVGNLLAHFPGFADQSRLNDKLDEAFQKLLDAAGASTISYVKDVKPYLAGPLVAAARAPAGAAAMTNPGSSFDGVVIATTDGTPTCAHLAGKQVTTTGSYRGLALLAITTGAGPMVDCTVSGRQIVFGTETGVRRAIDAKLDGTGIDHVARYATAMAALPGDHLAAGFLDERQLLSVTPQGATTATPLPSAIIAALPEWMAFDIRAQDGALVGDAVLPKPDVTSLLGQASAGSSPLAFGPDSVSVLAPRLPADTVAEYEAHDLGRAIDLGLRGFAATDPQVASGLAQLDSGLAMFGGRAGLYGWIGDAALVVTARGSDRGVGLVALAIDRTKARGLLDTFRNLIVVAGGSSGISIKDSDHAGTTITTVDLGDLSALGAAAGLPSLGVPAGTHVQISWAMKDDLVVIGSGESFVASVLDTRAGASLADQASYKAAIGLAGSSNSGQFYLDLAAVRSLVEPLVTGADATRYTQDIKPYLEPLGAIAFAGSTSGELIRARFVVTVK